MTVVAKSAYPSIFTQYCVGRNAEQRELGIHRLPS